MRNFLFLSLLVLICFSFGCKTQSTSGPDLPHQRIDLTSGWEFFFPKNQQWYPATVPGNIQLDLQRENLLPDPFFRNNEKLVQWVEENNWEYRKSFVLDANLQDYQNFELVFEGLDTEASIFLNDSLLGDANNMHRIWKYQASDLLVKGKNYLKVKFKSIIQTHKQQSVTSKISATAQNDAGADKLSPFVRKPAYQFGWDWAPKLVTSGIWKPVYLEAWNTIRLTDVQVHQRELDFQTAVLSVDVVMEAQTEMDIEVQVSISNPEKVQAQTKKITISPGTQVTPVILTIQDPKLWWTNDLGEQNLYQVEARIIHQQTELDSKHRQIGLRDLKVVQEPSDTGTAFYFTLNGVPVFAKGSNIVPQILNSPGPNYPVSLVKAAQDANMNMLRVWGGGQYPGEEFYNACDLAGILVWQDFAFANMLYPGDEAFQENTSHEAIDNILRLRNHPSLALWCGNNEIEVAWNNWGWQKAFDIHGDDSTRLWNDYQNLFENQLPQLVAQYDPGRFYTPTSPLSNWGKPENFNHLTMHYWGIWHGTDQFSDIANNVPRFMVEYGFQSFPVVKTIKTFSLESDLALDSEVMQNRQKSYKGSGMITDHMQLYYAVPEDFEDLAYVSQLLQAKALEMGIIAHRLGRPHCMGTLYWQLNDAWPGLSWSTVDYYTQWKLAQYRVRDLYEPITPLISQHDNRVKVHTTNDTKRAANGRISLQLLDFSGREIMMDEKEMEIEPGSPEKVWSFMLDSVLTHRQRSSTVAVATLELNTGEKYRHLHYFISEKEMQLNTAQIDTTWQRQDSTWTITLCTDVLAKNVYLDYSAFVDTSNQDQIENKGQDVVSKHASKSTKSNSIHFSDNGFDLLPGECKTVTVFYSELISSEQLKISSLESIYRD